jgi:hypothetical protein
MRKLKLSNEDIKELVELFPHCMNKELTQRFKCNEKTITRYARRYGLQKEGVKTGTVVKWSKGRTAIKIASGFELLHRYIWKQNHPGEEISPGEAIYFKDGNKENFDPDNLVKARIGASKRRQKKSNLKKREELRKQRERTEAANRELKMQREAIKIAGKAEAKKLREQRKALKAAKEADKEADMMKRRPHITLTEELLEELRKADAEKIPVRIDAKTTILVPKGTDSQKAIAAYRSKTNPQLNRGTALRRS